MLVAGKGNGNPTRRDNTTERFYLSSQVTRKKGQEIMIMISEDTDIHYLMRLSFSWVGASRPLNFRIVGLLTELLMGWQRQWFGMDHGRDFEVGKGKERVALGGSRCQLNLSPLLLVSLSSLNTNERCHWPLN